METQVNYPNQTNSINSTNTTNTVLPQMLILPKIADRFGNEKLFIDLNEFDIDKVVIGKEILLKSHSNNSTTDNKKKNYRHIVYYVYNGDLNLGTAVIEPLRLYCGNLKLRNDRPYIIPFKNTVPVRYIKLPHVTDSEISIKIETIIQSIKQKLIHHINVMHNNMISIEQIEKLNNESSSMINILNTPSSSLETSIIRLGGVSTCYKNTDITSLKDLQFVLRDPRYNSQTNDSYYNCNAILVFQASVTVSNELVTNSQDVDAAKSMDNANAANSINESNAQLRFRSCVDIMEMYHNKSKCESIMNPRNKITIFDNTLVL